MAKNTTKEAYYERLRNLADVKPSIKESQIRNLGNLIDYKRAADGIAYGIIKENHLYYLKKAGTKKDPNVADFAYIGGMSNIKDYQYKSLAEADKQRNMMFHIINEAITLKPNKSGTKMVLTEDVAGKEIGQAEDKLGDLDAASAEEVPAEPEGGAEMTAGLEAKPEGGEEMPPEAPAPEGGEEMPVAPEAGAEGGEEMPAPETGEEMPAPEGGEEGGEEGSETGEEMPTDGEENIAANTDGSIDEPNKELEKAIGKITNKIRKTEMTDAQVKSYVNSYLTAFKDKFRDIDIEDRKEMANKILKTVSPEEMDDLEASMPSSEEEPAAGIEENQQCAECGSFAMYAESMGYNTAESLMECGEEGVGNLISNYANHHADGMNDGDPEGVALVIKVVNPEILNQLRGDYGHEEYADKLTPYVEGMNESTDEENVAKLNELFGGLGYLGKKAGQAIGGAATNVYNTAKGAVKDTGQAIGQAATNVKQAYYTGEKNASLNKLQNLAADLGKQIAAVNANATKAGQEPINVNSILTTIKNQVGAKGTADLSKFKTTEGLDDIAKTQVQPNMNMIKEEDEEVEEKPFQKHGDKPLSFGADATNLGIATVKPDGAPTTGVDINVSPDKTVNISMNEAKVRKYIRNRLEEMTGIKKPVLNESKKSETLKKLDAIIAEQFKLYENVAKKKLIKK